jgi:hypothetical protein
LRGLRHRPTYHSSAFKQTFVQAGEMPKIPSRVRETATSAMIAVLLVVIVLFNLPASAITRAASPVVNAIALPLGLDQGWSVFAPTPPTRQEDVEVNVVMASGTVKTWTLPRANRVFGVPTSHRWRKFKESLVTTPDVRPDFVHWVVRKLTSASDPPVYVELVLRTEDMPVPGGDKPNGKTVQILYSENLAGPR